MSSCYNQKGKLQVSPVPTFRFLVPVGSHINPWMENRRVKKVDLSWWLLQPRWEELYYALAAQGSKFFVMSYLCRSAQFQFLEVYWQVFLSGFYGWLEWNRLVLVPGFFPWVCEWFLPFTCPMSENISQSQRTYVRIRETRKEALPFLPMIPMFIYIPNVMFTCFYMCPAHRKASFLHSTIPSASSKLLLKLSLDSEGNKDRWS